MAASLAQINEVGMHRIREHILGLGSRLRAGLEELGARIISPEDAPARSGITIFNMFESPQEDLELLKALLARKIFIAQRYTSGIGGLRASTHFYNKEEDVEALLAALRELKR